MCAITGLVALSGAPDARRLLESIRHRGPDHSGWVRRGACEIAAARLAIMDPAAGAQPMVDGEKGVCLAFNGEIYNAASLRDALTARGHRFRTACDTEVVLRGWIEWGPALAGRLSGMFAFAVLEDERLTLVRDPLGIKPLRFAHLGAAGTFLFASEAKALLRHPQLSPLLDEHAFADFIALGYPTGARTFFAGISTLPPGCSLTVTWHDGLRVSEPKPYARIAPAEGGKPAAAEEVFTEALLAAVKSHLQADTEVVLLLSGGIDSATLAFMAAELSGKRLTAFTVADAADHPDAVAARRVAQAIGAEHRLLTPGFDDYLAAIPATIAAVEAPDIHAGPFLHLLCREIGRSAKVCLNGEGADETLGGYFNPPATLAALRDGFRRAQAGGLTPSDRAYEIRERLVAAAQDRRNGIRGILDVELGELLERAQLDPVDHISMASAVEMRVPYLDSGVQAVARALAPDDLVDTALGITKRVLRRAALRRYGEPIADMALRSKWMMPDAGGRHAANFDRLCERMLSDDDVRRSDFGVCFAGKKDLVLFEVFRQTYFSAAPAQCPRMDDLLAHLTGAPLAVAS